MELPFSRSCPCLWEQYMILAESLVGKRASVKTYFSAPSWMYIPLQLSSNTHSSTTQCCSKFRGSTSWLSSTKLRTALGALRSISVALAFRVLSNRVCMMLISKCYAFAQGNTSMDRGLFTEDSIFQEIGQLLFPAAWVKVCNELTRSRYGWL